ncbi:MAG: sulfatase-like hydrolase/transferase, partial [Planctomycetaceae bacterium]|nr:sulfatase-like hydrolase/transferase [Planctomycetaceae bacterium]
MKIALLAVSFFLATGAGADADPQTTDNTQPGDKLPNVVFFLVDDLGWRDVGCFGSSFYETPHIDRLATEGVRFTQAYAACHVCSPTRASILTGKYPARLHMTDWLPGRREFPFQRFKNAEIHQHLPFAEVTLAEALKAQGYSTAIFGKWHLGEEPSGPLAHGFDVQVPRWNKGWPRTGYHAPFRLDGLKDT